jgi:hypothetical protein
VSIAEAGLAKLVLSAVLGGGDRRIAVSDGIGGGDGGSCGDFGVGRGVADAGVRIVSTVIFSISKKLSLAWAATANTSRQAICVWEKLKC